MKNFLRYFGGTLLAMALIGSSFPAQSQTTYFDRFNGAVVSSIGKAPVDAATTANIALTGYQTIDGVSVNADRMRVLVKNQTNQTTNGIYIVYSGAWIRSSDMAGPTGTVFGQLVYVTGGSTNKGLWQLTTANPVQIDNAGGQTTSASNITFTAAQFANIFSGSPATGNLAKFSSSSSLTNGDLSGDVTTSGALATTVAKIQSTTVSGTTGTGNVVFSTSPTLVTPALGTPASGVATNLTGTAAGLTAGSVTTNANLTGDVTSSGNATTVAKIQTKTVSGTTGTGNVVFSSAPTFTNQAVFAAIDAEGEVDLNASTFIGSSGSITVNGVFNAADGTRSRWYNKDDGTKQALFDFSAITTGNTRSYAFPDCNCTLAGLTATQTFTNKTLTSPTVNTATIAGGTINNAIIGGTTSAAITGTSITSNGTALSSNYTATFDGVNGNMGYNVAMPNPFTSTSVNDWIGYNISTTGISSTGALSGDVYGLKVGLISPSNTANLGSLYGVYLQGGNYSSSANASEITGFRSGSYAFSGTSYTSGFHAANLFLPSITSSSGNFGNMYGLNIGGASVTGSANPQANIFGINIGNSTYSGTAGGVLSAIGIEIGNQGGTGANNSYGLLISAQSASTNSSYAIYYNNLFKVNSAKGDTVSPGYTSNGTKFTASGCTNSATVGGATAGQFTSGTSGTCTVTVTMNGATALAAPNGWSCWANDITTGTAGKQTASSTVTATISVATTSGDTVSFGCMGY